MSDDRKKVADSTREAFSTPKDKKKKKDKKPWWKRILGDKNAKQALGESISKSKGK